MSTEPVVIGIGNRLRGDDGVGPAVARRVADHGTTADVVVCADPTALLDVWTGRRLAVVVDAADDGRSAGSVSTVDPAALGAAGMVGPAGSHGWGLAEAVALGQALDRMPERLVVVTVSLGQVPALVGTRDLSPAVATAVDGAASTVLAALAAVSVEPTHPH